MESFDLTDEQAENIRLANELEADALIDRAEGEGYDNPFAGVDMDDEEAMDTAATEYIRARLEDYGFEDTQPDGEQERKVVGILRAAQSLSHAVPRGATYGLVLMVLERGAENEELVEDAEERDQMQATVAAMRDLKPIVREVVTMHLMEMFDRMEEEAASAHATEEEIEAAVEEIEAEGNYAVGEDGELTQGE